MASGAVVAGCVLAACGPIVEGANDDAGGAGGATVDETDAGEANGSVPTAGVSGVSNGGAPSRPGHAGAAGETSYPSTGGLAAIPVGGASNDAAAGDGGAAPTPVSNAGAAGEPASASGGEPGSGGAGGDGNTPLLDVSPEPVTMLVSGSRHQCVLYGVGKVKCWGDNEFGQLGIGTTDHRGDQPGEVGSDLPDVDLGTDRYAKTLAAGWYVTCAILDDDTLKCWGAGSLLGTGDRDNRGDDPDEMGDKLLPVELGTGRTPLQVAAGAEHVCVVLDDGSAKCFGWNAWGQLGGPIPDQSLDQTLGNEPDEMGDDLPVLDVGVGVSVLQIAPGAMHTCALLSGGIVKCFGYAPGLGNYGVGSYGLPIENVPAVELGTGRTAKSITAGYSHSCAILDDDSVKCWGLSTSSELGLETGESRGYEAKPYPDMGDALPVVNLGTGRHALSLQAAGDQHTCALLDNHQLKCWGWNGLARLGSGDEVPRGSAPGEMGDDLPHLEFGATDEVTAFSTCVHGCALTMTGEVKCWGWNYYGELGLGDTETRGDGPGEMGSALPAVHFW